MKREGRAVWAPRIEEQESSGLSVAAFAEKIGVSVYSLRYWKAKLRRENGGSPSKASTETAPTFVEVSSGLLSQSTDTLEIVLEDGIMIRVPPDFDEDALDRVLGLLR